MKSQLVERLGVTVPQIVHLPPDVASLAAAEEAIELADAYGVADGFPLDESQRFTLRAALGERADGSWAAATVGDHEPRQSGKNDTLAARELAGLILFGEKLIIHTAHEFATANEAFLRLVAVFENWDDLRKRVAHIRYANGAQGIELLTGQRLLYKARTGGAGRGFAKADLTVYDEAQHLQAEHLAASGPARLANKNNQSWYLGSGGLSTSLNSWRMRRRALAGDGGRFAYVEHTAEQVVLDAGRVVSTRPDVLDRDGWVAANPAYGRRITDESLLSLFDELGPELFARECLCMWDPDPTNEPSVFGADVWRACCSPEHAPTGDIAFGVDVSPEREKGYAAIVACDEYGNIEVIDSHPGVHWLTPRILELESKYRCTIAVDSASPANSFADEWERAGVTVQRLSSREMAGACGTFFDAVLTGEVKVRTNPALDRAAAGVRKRDSGDVWYWARRDNTVDVSPLVAASIARWAAIGPSVYDSRGFAVLG